MKKIILSIDGMTCSACSNGLEKYLDKQPGIKNASVNLVMANATIEYDEKLLNQAQIEELVKAAGFKSLGEFKEIKVEKRSQTEKIKFVIFTILAVLLMYISMGHMINLPTIPFLDPHTHTMPYLITLLVLTLSFLVYGFDILKNGFKNLVHRTPNMDTLVSIGVTACLLYSIYNICLVFAGDHSQIMNLYFESAAIVIYFIKLGRYIDGISKDKTKEAIQKLVKITPNTATIKIGNKEKVVTLDEIHPGDIVVSKPGERIAVDGVITTGKAHLDESFITGESRPASKAIGDQVIAGSLNYDGYIEYKAERIGKDSTISEIVKLVIEASNTKAPIAQLADKVSGYFVPTVIVIAVVTFIVYLLIGQGFPAAITSFVTVLVVACPCSLGLATPLAIVISEGLCASHGILVKKSAILENAEKVNTVVFDKTGTLTYGKLKIAEILNYSDMNDQKSLQLVGSIEAQSSHPIGQAFTDYLEQHKLRTVKVTDFEDLSGYGIVGKIRNQKLIIGNAKILTKYGIKNDHSSDERKLAESGSSIVYVAKDQKIIALIGVNDVIRYGAKKVINTLNDHQIATIMLTGDNQQTATTIAQKLGINQVIANVVPREKAKIIKDLKSDHKYVMVCGDGTNDSPALASADIGVSVSSGTDIAMDSSDVILTRNDLTSILNLIKISQKTVRNIKQNLFWAFFYNILMIPIAIGILKPFGLSINPMIASLAMVFSSITVILNALRLKRIKLQTKA